jgi:hypothetical protein
VLLAAREAASRSARSCRTCSRPPATRGASSPRPSAPARSFDLDALLRVENGEDDDSGVETDARVGSP